MLQKPTSSSSGISPTRPMHGIFCCNGFYAAWRSALGGAVVGQEDGDAQLLLQLMTASHVQRRSPNDTEHSLTVWWTAPYRLGLFCGGGGDGSFGATVHAAGQRGGWLGCFGAAQARNGVQRTPGYPRAALYKGFLMVWAR